MTQTDEEHELFIALGIGGSPLQPEHLYVIPCALIDEAGVIELEKFEGCVCQQTAECFHRMINDYFCRKG